MPREAFVLDGVDLTTAYADDVVKTKWDPHGRTVSSISAPWLSLSTPIVLRSPRRSNCAPPVAGITTASSVGVQARVG
ncbi:hypothetical protein OHA25_13595 [Nonomuraea sp. NBC_00507]|uniref:hypothetical protein n=1 Tax=Nonomuraea sp. NBC_00507 TaxID=2976002 RepID=UPI002E1828BD